MRQRREAVFDTVVSQNASAHIVDDIKAAIQRGLAAIGIEAVFENAIAIVMVPVVDDRHVGTAYIEMRDGAGEMRILLADEPANRRV